MAKKTAPKKKKGKVKTDYTELKRQAEALYIDTGLTQKQIADLIGVSEQTITRWANEGEVSWEELRKLKSVGRPQALKKLYKKLADLADAPEDNADSIIKITAAIEKLSDRKITVPAIINTMMDFTADVMTRDLPLAQKITQQQKIYIKIKLRNPS